MKTAKLFINGRSQAVCLPKEFRFEGDEVYVKRVGNAVMLLPRRDSWLVAIREPGAFLGGLHGGAVEPVRTMLAAIDRG